MAAGLRVAAYSLLACVIAGCAVGGWGSYLSFVTQTSLPAPPTNITARLLSLRRGGGAGGAAGLLPRGETDRRIDVAALRAAVSGWRAAPDGASPAAGAAGAPPAPLKRVCGSPAVDGYAHVDAKCLLASPTAVAWRALHPHGGKSGEGLDCHTEENVSLDGLAVGWGIGNKKDSAEQCCQACRDHVPGPHVGGPFQDLPCNAWVFCPSDECFEADAHRHMRGDCWLKFTEAPQSPEVNARGAFPPEFRSRHSAAPAACPWTSGVLVPPGQAWTNGTWGPRAAW